MSFSFTACGPRDEAAAQLRSLVISDELGAALARELAAAVERADSEPLATGHVWRYVVEASGSGHGGPPSLNATLRSLYVPGVTLPPGPGQEQP